MRRLKVSDGKDWTFGEEDIIIDTGTEYSTNVTMNNTYVDTSTISSWSTDSITIGSNPNTTFTISGDDNMLKFDNDITLTVHEPVDFVDQLPTLQKIQTMCSEYPGLDKAFDNFKLAYEMVHQHWVGKQKEK